MKAIIDQVRYREVLMFYIKSERMEEIFKAIPKSFKSHDKMFSPVKENQHFIHKYYDTISP